MLAHIKNLIRLNMASAITVTLAPLVVAGLFVGIAWLAGRPALRYDPAYFTEEYRQRYTAPSDVVVALEDALRRDDRALMAELQGLRHPWVFHASPDVRMTILYEVSERYLSYLFWDTRTYERFPYHVEQVNGRWVVAPQDAQFFLNTGRWMDTWLPLALVWWLLGLTLLITTFVDRTGSRWRREMITG
jgi:hypothetical protein